MAKTYKQGIYVPINKEKYVGDVNNIVWRSSWELRAMKFFDMSKHVIEWSSEECIILYKSPADGRMHRYFTDFKIKVRTKDNAVKTFIIEVKPEKQIEKPKATKGKKKSVLLNEIMTYEINQAKWAAAEIYCKNRGWEFKKLNEYDLGIAKR